MANETILLVGTDSESLNALKISLNKEGYRVTLTDTITDALANLEAIVPDIIISETTLGDGNGMDFCADVKLVAQWKSIPFVLLTENRDLNQKMRALELGADDYLIKPVYIKEILTRIRLLLQKNIPTSSESIGNEISGELENKSIVELLDEVDQHQQSGSIRLEQRGRKAAIYFRQGAILDAICGKLQGEEALYRVLLWKNGNYCLRFHENLRRTDHIRKPLSELMAQANQRTDIWQSLISQLPSFDTVFAIDYAALPDALDQMPAEVERVVRLFDGYRTIQDVVDDSPVDDLKTLQIVRKLILDKTLTIAPMIGTQSSSQEELVDKQNLDQWLSEVDNSLVTPAPEPKSSQLPRNDDEWDKVERTNPGIQSPYFQAHPDTVEHQSAQNNSTRTSDDSLSNEALRRQEEARQLIGQQPPTPKSSVHEPTLRKVEAISRHSDNDDAQYSTEKTLLAIPLNGMTPQPRDQSPVDESQTPNKLPTDEPKDVAQVDTPIKYPTDTALDDAVRLAEETPLNPSSTPTNNNDIADNTAQEFFDAPVVADAVEDDEDFIYVPQSPWKKPAVVGSAVLLALIIGAFIFIQMRDSSSTPSDTEQPIASQAPIQEKHEDDDTHRDLAQALAQAITTGAEDISGDIQQELASQSSPSADAQAAAPEPVVEKPDATPPVVKSPEPVVEKPLPQQPSAQPQQPPTQPQVQVQVQAQAPTPEPPPKPKSDIPEQIKRIETLLAQDDTSSALELARQLSDQAPNNARAAFLHGKAAAYHNINQEAIIHLVRAEKLGWKTPELYQELGTVYQLVNFRDRAKQAYEKFLELQPTGPDADQVRQFLDNHF